MNSRRSESMKNAAGDGVLRRVDKKMRDMWPTVNNRHCMAIFSPDVHLAVAIEDMQTRFGWGEDGCYRPILLKN